MNFLLVSIIISFVIIGFLYRLLLRKKLDKDESFNFSVRLNLILFPTLFFSANIQDLYFKGHLVSENMLSFVCIYVLAGTMAQMLNPKKGNWKFSNLTIFEIVIYLQMLILLFLFLKFS